MTGKEMILPPKPLSVSSYTGFLDCPWEYWARRADIEATEGDPLKLGKAIHHFIETGKRVGIDKLNDNEELFAEYVTQCDAHRDYFPDDLFDHIRHEWEWALDYQGEMIPFHNPAAVKVTDEHGEIVEQRSEAKKYGLDAEGNRVPLHNPDAIVRGLDDFIGIQGNSLCLIDFKSSKESGRIDTDKRRGVVPVDKKRLPKDRQLRWYLPALMKILDDPSLPYASAGIEEIVFGHWYTREHKDAEGNMLSRLVVGSIPVKNLRKHIPLIIAEISDAFEEVQTACAEGSFPAHENKWCDWCGYGPKRGSDKCPHYNRLQEMADITKKSIEKEKPPAMPEPQNHVEAKAPSWNTVNDDASKLKIFLYGEEGTFKTRTGLTLFGRAKGDKKLAVIDTEKGAVHYREEFNFHWEFTTNPDEIVNYVKNPPKGIDTIMIDSFTLYCSSVTDKWVETFLIRETKSPGNKRDYYTMQPRDYKHPNREMEKMLKLLLDCPFNVVLTSHAKALYAEGEMMRKVGMTHDAYKQTPHYFDTVIFLEKGKKGIIATAEKDRTHKLPDTPWEFTPEDLAVRLGLAGAKKQEAEPRWEVTQPEMGQPTEADLEPNITAEQINYIKVLRKAVGKDVYESIKVSYLQGCNPKEISETDAVEWIAILEAQAPDPAI